MDTLEPMIGDIHMLLIGAAFALFFISVGFFAGWRARGRRG